MAAALLVMFHEQFLLLVLCSYRKVAVFVALLLELGNILLIYPKEDLRYHVT